MLKSHLIAVLFILFCTTANAQKDKYWFLQSPGKDKIYGVAATEAYQLLKNKDHRQVIVAVIDIGTDVDHVDLSPYIWTNPKEVPGNGIDDDHNGYVDDIHGWSFLGGKDGDIEFEASEETRQYQSLRRKIANIDTTQTLSGEDAALFREYKKSRKKYKASMAELQENSSAMDKAYAMNKKWVWRLVFRMAAGKTAGEQIAEARKQAANMLKYNTIDADSFRMAIVGDDPEDAYERGYGNNHVRGPEASHGTHVAGIIAAIAKDCDVRIMVVRAVPWGDERDKDVANAIRYAVDNGASVINMSFGKEISPNKDAVDAAVQYAMEHDVLLVHGAGNESRNVDTCDHFPTATLQNGTVVTNWIEVGSTKKNAGGNFVSSFSNYGKKTVDLFAPGSDIYSTLPDNKYSSMSGTSMASPMVAGVAAIIRSYFPNLTAPQVRTLLMQTVTKYDGEVALPGTDKVDGRFSEMSASGGVVNATNAVKLALKEN